jgi:hypothetical protein
MATLDKWLRPIFIPLAHFALAALRAEQARTRDALAAARRFVIPLHIAAEDARAKGSGGVLNQAAQKRQRGPPGYTCESVADEVLAAQMYGSGVVPRGEMWKVVCTAVDDEGRKV